MFPVFGCPMTTGFCNGHRNHFCRPIVPCAGMRRYVSLPAPNYSMYPFASGTADMHAPAIAPFGSMIHSGGVPPLYQAPATHFAMPNAGGCLAYGYVSPAMYLMPAHCNGINGPQAVGNGQLGHWYFVPAEQASGGDGHVGNENVTANGGGADVITGTATATGFPVPSAANGKMPAQGETEQSVDPPSKTSEQPSDDRRGRVGNKNDAKNGGADVIADTATATGLRRMDSITIAAERRADRVPIVSFDADGREIPAQDTTEQSGGSQSGTSQEPSDGFIFQSIY